jgi:2-keto-4-pentenoate hydratase
MSSQRTAELAADPRVRRGMEAQLATRRERLAAGGEPLGWKVGFGTPQAFEKLGTSAPLVGYLLKGSRIDSLEGFAAPALEPEVAVRVGEGHTAAALAPAFELADVEDTDDVEGILAGDIFHRGVLLGPMTERSSLDGAAATVIVNGEPTRVEDPEAMPGPIEGLVAHVAALLPAFGEELRPGDVIITGSLMPPLKVAPGDRVGYELEGFGSISVSF